MPRKGSILSFSIFTVKLETEKAWLRAFRKSVSVVTSPTKSESVPVAFWYRRCVIFVYQHAETLSEKAFRDNWFNSTYDLNISEEDLVDLLSVATKGQSFQVNGALFKQIEGVAVGSPRPLPVNECVYDIIGRKTRAGGQAACSVYYRRYVDDSLTVMPDITTATDL